MILTHPISRLLKQVLQKTAWEPSFHLLFCFSPQYSESTKPQLRGRCFRGDHGLMNCERLPCLSPSSRSRCAGGWEGWCATPLLCKTDGHSLLLERFGAEGNAECRVSPLNTLLSQPLCAGHKHPPHLLPSPPRHTKHSVIPACPTAQKTLRYLGS